MSKTLAVAQVRIAGKSYRVSKRHNDVLLLAQAVGAVLFLTVFVSLTIIALG